MIICPCAEKTSSIANLLISEGMIPEMNITTERIDDFPFLLEMMQRLGLPGINDQHLRRHGLQQ
ncbi:MAG: hypothetical protein C4545_00645 [Anaerolineaceae bacterium]|jgi:hypothetical protein|nr:MAG: hypothetical protein C4545_00645 [Anaerolineaceae bacterium]